MRKITSILMLLLFVFSSGVSAQGFKVSTDAEKHWFVIKNFRSGKFAAYGGEENAQKTLRDICQLTLDNLTSACYWYAVADGEGYKLYNAAATGKVVDGHGWSDAGRTMYVKASSVRGGYYTISTEKDPTQSDNGNTYGCWDDQDTSNGIGYWYHVATDNEGTSWLFVNVDDPTTLVSKEKVALAVAYATAKAELQAAITKVNFLVGVNPGQYPSTDDCTSAIAEAQKVLNNATATKEDYDKQRTALETALSAAQAQQKNDMKIGCYYRIQNTAHQTYTGIEIANQFAGTSQMKNSTLSEDDPRQIWKFEQDGEKYYLVNVASGLYPQYVKSWNYNTTDVGAKDASKDFTWTPQAGATSTSNAQYNIFVGGRQINVETNGNVNQWNGNNAHHYLWKVEKTDAEILTLVNKWATDQNLTANANATKLKVIDGVTQVISPNEFAAPSVVNAAIDAVKAYAEASAPTLEQAQKLYNNYSIVNNYVNNAKANGDILDVEYDLKGQYGTIILPVNYAIPTGLKFYTCNGAENGVLTLVEASGAKKNTPYIVEYTGESGMPEVTAPNKYQIIGYKNGAATTNQTVGWLTGVLEENCYVPSGSYILSKYNGRFAFYKVDGDNVKKAAQYRCYLTIPAAQPTAVSAFYLNGEGETTGINALLNANGKTEIYDLSGKRLNHLQKGINIVNGQKVLVK